ncbi:hypothetical protein OHR68_37715 [Spirillospora sp. NBC_00431]
MSGDHHTSHPVHGVAAGDAYVALPPTAVDATASGPTRLIVAWPGFDPPRTASALAAAIPMTGVPVWRVYLDLPGHSPGGLGSGAILETETIETYCAAVENAVERLPAALADIRRDLGLPDDPDGPVGLAGFSAGGAAALLAVARDAVPVSAVALVAPVVAPSRAARAVEKRSGRDRAWTEEAAALADRLDLGSLAGDLAGRDVATLLIGGAKDRVVPAREITSLRDLLRRHDAGPVESATFRMGHALAAEPGTEARPPITEAVRVDGVLTDWFRERLAEPPTSPPDDTAPADAQPADALRTTADASVHRTGPRPANNPSLDSTAVTTQPINVPPVNTRPPEMRLASVHPVAASQGGTQPVNPRPTGTPTGAGAGAGEARTAASQTIGSPEASTEPANAEDAPAETARTPGDRPPAGGDGTWSSGPQSDPTGSGADDDAQKRSAAAGCGFGHVR